MVLCIELSSELDAISNGKSRSNGSGIGIKKSAVMDSPTSGAKKGIAVDAKGTEVFY
jgi:hypothetical protein